MKTVGLNKEVNYSLHNIDNYNKELDTNVYEITNKYSGLLMEYFKFIIENIKLKKQKLARVIIIRGLDTITNVFLNLLLYTKNIDITYFHCQKSFYFYVEFVGQISEDEKMFLQLSSRDASTYVYKKTIFEINNEFKKINDNITENSKTKISIINSYINIYRTYMYKIIYDNNFNTNGKLLHCFEVLTDKLNSIIVDSKKIKMLENITDKLYDSISDCQIFLNINILIVKKFIKNQEILNNCEKKFIIEEFTNKINDSPDKFVNWLIN